MPPLNPIPFPQNPNAAMQEITMLKQALGKEQNTRLQLCSLLMALVREKGDGGPLFVSIETLKAIQPTDQLHWTDQPLLGNMKIELKTQEQSQEEAAKLQAGVLSREDCYAIPSASPFHVKVEPPDDGTFVGDGGVRYKNNGGKSLKRVNKLPKFAEYSVDANGNYIFSVDSSSFQVLISYSYRPGETKVEETYSEGCGGVWHSDSEALGLLCPECGSKAKTVVVVT